MSRALVSLLVVGSVLVAGATPAALQFETDPADRAVHFGKLVFSVDR